MMIGWNAYWHPAFNGTFIKYPTFKGHFIDYRLKIRSRTAFLLRFSRREGAKKVEILVTISTSIPVTASTSEFRPKASQTTVDEGRSARSRASRAGVGLEAASSWRRALCAHGSEPGEAHARTLRAHGRHTSHARLTI